MSAITAPEYYQETISLSDGLANELGKAEAHTRFRVLQKHIRFIILDIIVRREQNMDLKSYILHNHHEGGQLSQRDITSNLKRIVDDMDEEKKLSIMREAFEEIWRMLKEINIANSRVSIHSALNSSDDIGEEAKRTLLNKAIGDNGEDVFLERLKSFDQKTIVNFIEAFGLTVRREREKWSGRSTKQKSSDSRIARNNKMWADPQTRQKLCDGMQRSWRVRKISALYEE